MLSAVYGAAAYGGAEYAHRRSTAYANAISETVTAAMGMGNVLVFTATPSLRTYLIPIEKRTLS